MRARGLTKHDIAASKKNEEDACAARFYRKGAGRLTKREARALGRRYSRDLHWKYMHLSGDKLARRETGTVAQRVAWYRDEAKHRGVPFRDVARRYAQDAFWWYGPTSGRIWPGDSLVWSERAGLLGGGAWIVKPGNG